MTANGRCSGGGKLGDGKVREAVEERKLVRKETVGVDMLRLCVTRVVKPTTKSTCMLRSRPPAISKPWQTQNCVDNNFAGTETERVAFLKPLVQEHFF